MAKYRWIEHRIEFESPVKKPRDLFMPDDIISVSKYEIVFDYEYLVKHIKSYSNLIDVSDLLNSVLAPNFNEQMIKYDEATNEYEAYRLSDNEQVYRFDEVTIFIAKLA